jgi:hypothetical protein
LLFAGGRSNTIFENGVFVLGAVALGVSAGIHLHLWMNGYSVIHTIGPLFLIQSIAGFILAAVVVVFRRVLSAVLGLGYMLATITGFLVSVHLGLFGFQDTWSAPFARAAFWDEVAGATVLLVAAGATASRALRHPPRP